MRTERSQAALIVIGVFKLFKGFTLILVAAGVLSLVHRDVADVIQHLVDRFRVDPDNHYLHLAVTKLTTVSERDLRAIGFGTLFYAALFLTEGCGLLLRKRWAEYFTIIVTGSFLPLELYELFVHLTWEKVLLTIVNVAIVAYLVWNVRQHPKAELKFDTAGNMS